MNLARWITDLPQDTLLLIRSFLIPGFTQACPIPAYAIIDSKGAIRMQNTSTVTNKPPDANRSFSFGVVPRNAMASSFRAVTQWNSGRAVNVRSARVVSNAS